MTDTKALRRAGHVILEAANEIDELNNGNMATDEEECLRICDFCLRPELEIPSIRATGDDEGLNVCKDCEAKYNQPFDFEAEAKKLYNLSTDLGVTMGEINDLGKLNYQVIKNNEDAYETLMFDGENVSKALRTIAMAMDRAVIIKCQPDD